MSALKLNRSFWSRLNRRGLEPVGLKTLGATVMLNSCEVFSPC
jgi:hypothetical protein